MAQTAEQTPGEAGQRQKKKFVRELLLDLVIPVWFKGCGTPRARWIREHAALFRAHYSGLLSPKPGRKPLPHLAANITTTLNCCLTWEEGEVFAAAARDALILAGALPEEAREPGPDATFSACFAIDRIHLPRLKNHERLSRLRVWDDTEDWRERNVFSF